MPGRVHTDRTAAQGLTPDDVFGAVSRMRRDERRSGSAQRPREGGDGPSYYDVSILKEPVWKWEIAGYFFLGGLSAGAYLLARLAERFGGEGYRDLTRVGTAVAFLTSLPCAPLLIKDLGDPKRFHHMLRVWKPSTPMNLGTWTLTAYSGAATASLLREYLRGRGVTDHERGDLARLGGATALAIHDAAGVPLALLLAGYTGVLVSNTANPMWCRNPWLGPLFSASAVATGAEAVSLSLDATGKGSDAEHTALERVSTLAHVAEGAALAGYLRHAGATARPITRGGMKHHLWLSVGGLLAAEALKHVPAQGRAKRWCRMASAAAGLAAGFSMRWGMVYGGQEAARDPDIARLATGPDRPSKGRPRSLASASGRLAHGGETAPRPPRPDHHRSPAPPYAPREGGTTYARPDRLGEEIGD